jgi:hypothetical protein
MERNVAVLKTSRELREGTAALVERCVTLAGRLRASDPSGDRVARGGRKAHALGAPE